MDKNQGYTILKAVMLENGRGFALGEHPRAPSPLVTWGRLLFRQRFCVGQMPPRKERAALHGYALVVVYDFVRGVALLGRGVLLHVLPRFPKIVLTFREEVPMDRSWRTIL